MGEASLRQDALVLVIEDDADLAALLARGLQRAGFEVALAASGAEGLAVARRVRPAVVVLDVGLPDQSGREVCRRLRADARTRDVHLILVSGAGDEAERVAGLEAGADDFVPKPVSLRELGLRANAALRRIDTRRPTRARATRPGVARAPRGVVGPPAPVRVDETAHRVFVGADEVLLTLTEYRLLAYLVQNPGKLCSRGELLQRVWDLPAHLNTRTVDTHVKRLRTKLGEAAASIETVRGAGYRYQSLP